MDELSVIYFKLICKKTEDDEMKSNHQLLWMKLNEIINHLKVIHEDKDCVFCWPVDRFRARARNVRKALEPPEAGK